MEPGHLTIVLNDFLTTVDGELSLSKGEYFLIHNVIDKHWCFGESCNRRGRFPTIHLHKVDIPPVKDTDKLFISIAPFRGEQDGDLAFDKGEIIIGVHDVDADWHAGRIDDRTGMFPLSYAWLLNPSILKKPTDKKAVRKKAKVKTSLCAQLDEELDLTAGEIVTVLEILNDGWVRALSTDGRTGTCPEGFLSYITEESIDENDQAGVDSIPVSTMNGGKIFKDFGQSESSYNYEEQPAPSYYDLFPGITKPELIIDPPLQNETENYNPLGVDPYAITLYPFNAQFPNELNFEAGEVVHLTKHIDTEWAEGEINGEFGIFPTSYVNIIVNCAEPTDQIQRNDQEIIKDHRQLCKGDFVKVEHTFSAQMSGDLSIAEGELVTVIEMANDDWVSVQNEGGSIGLCPRGYLSDKSQESSESDLGLLDDFVVIREHHKKLDTVDDEPKRLSEPHRPAPPAPAPGSVPLQKQSVPEKNDLLGQNRSEETSQIDEMGVENQKRADQRQNVISELVITEKEYIRDLKATYETFQLYDPSILQTRGIDVQLLFGNILEIIHVAEELLDSILKAMKGCDESEQMISPCFLNMTDKLQTIYGKYCGTHEAALALLKKYEENKEIMSVFDKGIETLRYQVACFDMSSILIKPVQRIVKYPLMLYELVKCTDDSHPDKSGIAEAWKAMTAVASHINEYKRRKDLVSKYFDSDNTLIRKMSKLNMHSVAKMSSRLSAKLSATLGYTNITPDYAFEELERQFKSLEKCTWQLAVDVMQCMTHLDEEAISCELISDFLKQYHSGVIDNEVNRYNDIRVTIRSEYMRTLKETVDKRVNQPLTYLIGLLTGPSVLITKRYDKLLDYDNAISKSEKYKDTRSVQDELVTTKKNYEALNQQLMEELPVLIDAATKIIVNCIGAFASARKLLSGKIMRRYLSLSETTTQVVAEDVLQSFLVNHNLLWNQISRFSFGGVNPKIEETTVNISPQSAKQRATLINKQPKDRLFIVTEDIISSSMLDLGVKRGTVVAVIKKQDPMGDSSRWFVDNGDTKGFVPSRSLQSLSNARPSNPNTFDVVDSRTSPPDLMCLDSPVKEIKQPSVFLDNLSKEPGNSIHPQSRYYSVVEDINQNDPSYDNSTFKTETRYENLEVQFYYAQYDFSCDMPGTLTMKEGQVLKLIKPCDEKNNSAWWLMENRRGSSGYVPSNYLKIFPNST